MRLQLRFELPARYTTCGSAEAGHAASTEAVPSRPGARRAPHGQPGLEITASLPQAPLRPREEILPLQGCHGVDYVTWRNPFVAPRRDRAAASDRPRFWSARATRRSPPSQAGAEVPLAPSLGEAGPASHRVVATGRAPARQPQPRRFVVTESSICPTPSRPGPVKHLLLPEGATMEEEAAQISFSDRSSASISPPNQRVVILYLRLRSLDTSLLSGVRCTAEAHEPTYSVGGTSMRVLAQL